VLQVLGSNIGLDTLEGLALGLFCGCSIKCSEHRKHLTPLWQGGQEQQEQRQQWERWRREQQQQWEQWQREQQQQQRRRRHLKRVLGTLTQKLLTKLRLDG